MKRVGILLLLGPSLFAQDTISFVDPAVAPSHQEGFPLWAYGYIEAPNPPEDWSQILKHEVITTLQDSPLRPISCMY